MSIVSYEAPVVRLNPYLERLLSFVHVLPPTAFTKIIESCMKLEKSMFGLQYLDDNLEDMGLTRVYLIPNVLFEEIVEYNHILALIQKSFFLDYNDSNDFNMLQPIELFENIHLIEDDEEYNVAVPGSTLADLANDDENIHTRPIRQETARAIQILMKDYLQKYSYAEELLILIRTMWFHLLTAPLPDWAIVLDEPLCDEFYMDLLITSNFDTKYSDLLQSIWTYACDQPIEIRSQIAIRLAEEVIDGEGMCPQGKMSRLLNVLRGFHPELDAIPAISISEQLQSRMAVISAMPIAERAAAASAVFAELSISEAIQAEWMNALLEF